MDRRRDRNPQLRPHLRLRDCYAFFAPLVLMVELNMISKSAIHAFLARTAAPDVTLAAFNAGFTFYYAITSATEVIVALSLAYLKSRRDLWRVIGFTALVLAGPWTLALCAVFTPLGAVVFGEWFSLSAQGQVEARWTVGILALSAPVLLMRGTAFALLMLNRKTIIITCSTFVRLASLGLSLLVLPLWLEGRRSGRGRWCSAWRRRRCSPGSLPGATWRPCRRGGRMMGPTPGGAAGLTGAIGGLPGP